MERCLEITIDYAKERKVFGKPLTKFQNTQFVIADMAAEIEQKLAEFQQLGFQWEQELNARQQQLLGAIGERLDPVVKEIAEAEGLTFVLEKGAVLYGPSALDLTNELIRKYNARYAKKGAPAAGAAPAAPKK